MLVFAAIWAIICPLLADCASCEENYIPPEYLYARELSQTITLPEKRVNINRISLNQLRILPGLDEDLALKIFRSRPFLNMQDLYRKLPTPRDRAYTQRTLTLLQPYIQFK